MLVLRDHLPDRERAARVRPSVVAALATASWFLAAASDDQQADGGWPVRWEPPSEASRLEWRGIRTVAALRTLRGYGRR